MANALVVSVKFNGGLFEKDVPRVVEKQIEHEILTKVEERLNRGGKGLGARRNQVEGAREGFGTLKMHSTLRNPRQSGKAWQRKSERIVASMAPRVGNAAAKRIAEELGA